MNVFENIPHQDKGLGKRKVFDDKHLQIMQIALKSGQSVPQHKANSYVHLLVLKGKVVVDLDGADHKLKEGDLLPVDFQTPMLIKNSSDKDATFLVIKAPNPSEMQK